MPRRLRAIRPAASSVRSGPMPTPSAGSSRVRYGPGGAGEQVGQLPGARVEPRGPGEHRVADRDGQRRRPDQGGLLADDLGDEEGVPAREPVEVGGVDVALPHQRRHRRHRQRVELPTRASPTACARRPRTGREAPAGGPGSSPPGRWPGSASGCRRSGAAGSAAGRWSPRRPTAGRRRPGSRAGCAARRTTTRRCRTAAHCDSTAAGCRHRNTAPGRAADRAVAVSTAGRTSPTARGSRPRARRRTSPRRWSCRRRIHRTPGPRRRDPRGHRPACPRADRARARAR